MNVALYIARRYLFSSKSKNAVNIITGISVLGVAVGTLALVVVLSVFNGFESLIKSMYHEVNADFVVRSVASKSFGSSSYDLEELKALAPWESIQEVCEEKVLLRFEDQEQIAKLKGVQQWPSSDSLRIEKHIFKGRSFRGNQRQDLAIVGQALAHTLSIPVDQYYMPLRVYVPNVSAKIGSLERPFTEGSWFVSGIYSVQANHDASYVLCSLSSVQDFLGKQQQVTSLEFQAKDANAENLQEALQTYFGSDFEVKNRYQQQAFLYKVLKTEKWAIFFILSFILLIATFTIVASVIMIVLEKRKDISSLWAMGTPEHTIQRIFFYEGLLITFFGGAIGLFFGVVLCLLQQKFGFLKIGAQGSFVINNYPVEVQTADVLLIMLTVLSLGMLITWIPVRLLKRKFIQGS